jgi:hypothetical protein
MQDFEDDHLAFQRYGENIAGSNALCRLENSLAINPDVSVTDQLRRKGPCLGDPCEKKPFVEA